MVKRVLKHRKTKILTHFLALLLQTLLHEASKSCLAVAKLPACLANPVAGGTQAGTG